MTRPLRLEFDGAVYHVTSRGDRQENIYLDDDDRRNWLDVLGIVCERFKWVVHAYCQMSNHYHLLVETPEGNLSKGMRQLNGIYTQRFNRRHDVVGHLYQGRYRAILVQKEAYLLELTRYIVLNPLRAGMVESPEIWPWSSYPATMGAVAKPKWQVTDWLLSRFGGQRKEAISALREFVMDGKGMSSPMGQIRHQLFLGDESFIKRHRQHKSPEQLREVSMAHKRSVALSLDEYLSHYPRRNEAMAHAYLSGAYTMAEIGQHFGVHYMTVSRAVRRFEEVGKVDTVAY